MLPIVSILIPVYNAEAYLAVTLDSCLQQTFRDFEVIAVNDGSTDQSALILEEYVRKDSRIKVVNQVNQGANAARKNAVEQACGEYVCFLDADDMLVQNALQNLWLEIQKGRDYIVIGGICFREQKTDSIFINRSPFGKGKMALFCSVLSEGGFLPSLCAKLIRRDLFIQMEWVEHLLIGEDAVVVYQLLHQTDRVSFVEEVVYIYEQHENSVSHRLSLEARNSIIRFCIWSEAFFEKHGYFKDLQFCNSYAENILASYYRFLREGGAPTDFPVFTKKINSYYLKNKKACKSSPVWRIGMLKIYRFNPVLGIVFRNLFRIGRKVIRKIIYG